MRPGQSPRQAAVPVQTFPVFLDFSHKIEASQMPDVNDYYLAWIFRWQGWKQAEF
jgi:hypothetical protein